MLDRTTRRITLLLTCGLQACAMVGASTALAGTYTVQSCGSTGSIDGWSAVNTAGSSMLTSSACGGTNPGDGLRAADVLPSPDVIGTTTTAWRFEPPTGTSITTVVMRDFVKKYDTNWVMGMNVPSGPGAGQYEDCVITGGGFCQFAGQFDVTLSGIDAPYVEWGAFCRPVAPDTGCGTGFSVNDVQADLYRATLTIKDTVAPGSAVLSGTPAGWVRSLTGTVSGTDSGGGVGALELVGPSGELLGSSGSSCSFVLARPCPASRSAAVNGDLSALADGERQVRGRVVDAGGESLLSTPVTVRVDRTAPDTPVGVTGDADWSPADGVTLSVPHPAQPFAPIAQVRTELCTPTCAVSTTTAASGSPTAVSVAGLPEGTSQVRVRLVDEAGNESGNASVSVQRDRTSPSPRIDGLGTVYDGDLVRPTVGAEDALSGVATVSREVQIDGGQWTAAADGVVAQSGRTYRFRAVAADVAGNTAMVQTESVTAVRRPEPTPVPTATATPVPTPAATPVPTVSPGPPSARPVVRISSLSGRRGRDGRVTVRLRGRHSVSSGRARVRVQLGRRVVVRSVRAVRGRVSLDLKVRAAGSRVSVRLSATGAVKVATRSVRIRR
ncbi:hypothetical protein GKE82_24935 [Conexibacter sp. W3-3-2]|uniref:hypothetical protein n=1 Tax=Conexibacter sp. W3-3-2 TaxID=2675227 RepID=UPI0012B73D68|nr:hypothetical protein [Conexibacter sp. W3-3-2]MTD47452.1 hypothetical protein [Conexibacter sp. W3-3-2]